MKKLVYRNRKRLVIGLAILLLFPVLYAGYAYAATPAAIRNPLLEHTHFRMQVVVEGKAENFGDKKYQTPFDKGLCNSLLPAEPIHFHDNKNQFVHIHWRGVTGGQVLKYYGWNRIGGLDSILGYRLDNITDKGVRRVPTYGNVLPAIPQNKTFYVYIGDKDNYSQKTIDEFTNQDLEQFFDKASNFPGRTVGHDKTGLVDSSVSNGHGHTSKSTESTKFDARIHPPEISSDFENPSGQAVASNQGVASNMGDTTNEATIMAADATESELSRINNLLGNVVIFVQADKPSEQQIKDRFSKLEPLTKSTCGG